MHYSICSSWRCNVLFCRCQLFPLGGTLLYSLPNSMGEARHFPKQVHFFWYVLHAYFIYTKIAFFTHKNEKHSFFIASYISLLFFLRALTCAITQFYFLNVSVVKSFVSNLSRKITVWEIWFSAQFISFFVSLISKDERETRSNVHVSTFLLFAFMLFGSFLCQRSWMARLLTN